MILSDGMVLHTPTCNGQEPPAYLPHQSKYTNLVVLECHVRLCHSGPMHTFTAARISFWIPKGKPTTQVIIDDFRNYTLGVGRGQDECIGGALMNSIESSLTKVTDHFP